MSFVDFVVLPPGCGDSVTDFWGWDAHEAQLRCPDGVRLVIEGDVVPGGALNLNSTNLPRPWSPRESSPSRKTSAKCNMVYIPLGSLSVTIFFVNKSTAMNRSHLEVAYYEIFLIFKISILHFSRRTLIYFL